MAAANVGPGAATYWAGLRGEARVNECRQAAGYLEVARRWPRS